MVTGKIKMPQSSGTEIMQFFSSLNIPLVVVSFLLESRILKKFILTVFASF